MIVAIANATALLPVAQGEVRVALRLSRRLMPKPQSIFGEDTLLDAIVGSFPSDDNVVHMTFAQARGGNAHKAAIGFEVG